MNEKLAEFQAKKRIEALRHGLSVELESYLGKDRRHIEDQIKLGKMTQADLDEHEQAAKETRESLASKDDAWIIKHQHNDGRDLYQVL